MKNFGTTALTVLTFLMLALFAFGCADGDNGVDGITGPSGVDELSSETCAAGKVLEATEANDGTVTFACVDAP